MKTERWGGGWAGALRKAHRWLALLIGVQALLWMVSGLYMTAVSIDIIHGDHLVHTGREALDLATPVRDPVSLGLAPGAAVRLKRWMGREVYEVRDGDTTRLIDARTGALLSPLGQAAARNVAESLYHGDAPVETVRWLTEAPAEVGGRPPPMWEVRFADRVATTVYVSPFTGERLATRHSLWRAFDALWMLHIMDYRTREDISNPLLRIAGILGLLFALSGAALLAYTLRRRAA